MNLSSEVESEDDRPRKRPHLEVSESDDSVDDSESNVQDGFDDGQDESTCGRIMKVHLVNFMCHANLLFTFGKKINFVSGKNGSGKSAILAAIMIGLGGKTTDTKRGHSLKELIQKGKNKATITITLSNVGIMSHEPQIFGRELTIQRTITTSSSSFKLLIPHGGSQSLTARELKLILMRFNIQIANPLCVLTQDTARSFLRTSTSKERYELFSHGTLLKSIQDKSVELDTVQKPKLTNLIEEKHKNFVAMYNDLAEYEKKLEVWTQVDELESKRNVFLGELRWEYASSVEKKYMKTERALEENQRSLEQIKSSISDLKNELEMSKAQNQKCKEDIQKLKDEKNQGFSDRTELQQKLGRLKKEIEKKRIDLSQNKNALSKHESSVSSIISARKEIEEAARAKQAEKENEMQKLVKRYEELSQVKLTSEVHVKQLQDTYFHLQEKSEALHQRILNLVANIRTKENYLKHLHNKSTQYEVYAKWMPDLLQKIEIAHSQNKFVKKPIGPMGSFIKVKQKDWAPTLETYVGRRFLKGFAVHCNQDYQLFKKIIQSLNIPNHQTPDLSVFPFSDAFYNFRPNQTRHPRFEAMVDMFEIKNPVVMNSMIDAFQVDRILLVPTREESYQLMKRKESVPQNCQMVLTMNGDTIYPAPNYSFYSGAALLQPQFMDVCSVDKTRAVAGEIKDLNHEKSKLENDLKVLNVSVEESRKTLNDAKIKLRQITNEMAKNAAERENCDSSEIVAQQRELDSELQYRNQQIEILKTNIERSNQEKENAVKELERINGILKEKKDDYENYVKNMKELEARLHENEAKMNMFTSSYGKENVSLKLFEDKCKELKKRVDEIKIELDKALAEAAEISSEKVQTNRESSEIERDLEKVQAKIKSLMKIVPSKPSCPPRYERRLEELREVLEICGNLKKLVKELCDTSEEIKRCCCNVRKRTDRKVNNDFESAMEARNISGSILIDHDREKLDFELKTRGSNSQAAVKTLSGGETSFAMVSFILSIWTIMTCPFLVMDEFDVFMDNVNRKTTMELLLTHARKHANQQFIFLTPHSLTEEADADISIFRMEDPRKV